MHQETKLITAGKDYKKHSGCVNVPIHKTSTILFPSMQAYNDAEAGKSYYNQDADSNLDYSYGISGTETSFALQKALCEIEKAKYCLLYPSGLSAISSCLLALLKQGDHVLVSDSVYGPTRRFCDKELTRYGIETTYYDPLIGEDIKNLIKPNTKLIFTESPGSLTFEVQDTKTITKIAKSQNIPVLIDNSWAGALYFDAFANGIDISLQAATKYIGGHSDLLMGIITTNDEKLFKALANTRRYHGIHISADDCYLALRGLKTLAVRLKTHEKSALDVAHSLSKHPLVKTILHPAFESCPGHEFWRRDFTGSTGLFSIVLDKTYSKKQIETMVDNMKLFGIGASWGGFESLIMPISPSNIRTAKKWQEPCTVLRLYIGLEAVEDIKNDIEQGLDRLLT